MAEETRRRIVEATFDLHFETSIAGTTMRDIAERAGVSVGTVYHHFPTYGEAVEACGTYILEKSRPPQPAIFRGLRSPKERVAHLAAELFAFYERLGMLERARAERHLIPAVEQKMKLWEAIYAALIREALGAVEPRQIAFAAALLDPAVHSALLARGLTTAEAAAEVAEAILWRLKRARKPKGGK